MQGARVGTPLRTAAQVWPVVTVKVCDVPVEVLTCTSRPRVVSTTSYVVDLPSRVTDLTVAPAGNVCPIVSVQPAGAETTWVVYRLPFREADAVIVPSPTLRSFTERPGQDSGTSGTTERLLAGTLGSMPRKWWITGHWTPYEDQACMNIARSRKSTNGSYSGLGEISGKAPGISRSSWLAIDFM